MMWPQTDAYELGDDHQWTPAQHGTLPYDLRHTPFDPDSTSAFQQSASKGAVFEAMVRLSLLVGATRNSGLGASVHWGARWCGLYQSNLRSAL